MQRRSKPLGIRHYLFICMTWIGCLAPAVTPRLFPLVDSEMQEVTFQENRVELLLSIRDDSWLGLESVQEDPNESAMQIAIDPQRSHRARFADRVHRKLRSCG